MSEVESRRSDLCKENSRLRHNNESPFTGEYHIGGYSPQEELAQKRALGVPDLHAFACTGVYVPIRVQLDTVGYTCVAVSEETTVFEDLGFGVDVEGVTTRKCEWEVYR